MIHVYENGLFSIIFHYIIILEFPTKSFERFVWGISSALIV